MQRFIFVCFLVLQISALSAQNRITKQERHALNSTLEGLFLEGVDFWLSGNKDSAVYFFQKVNEKSSLNNAVGYWQGRSASFLSLAYIDEDSAISSRYFQESIKSYQLYPHLQPKIYQAYSDRAQTQRRVGQIAEALNTIQEGQRLIKDPPMTSIDTSNMVQMLQANVDFFLEIGDPESAMEKLESSSFTANIAPKELYELFGQVYFNLDSLDLALNIYLKNLDYQKSQLKKRRDSLVLGFRMNDLAEIYLAKNDLERAKAYLDSAYSFQNGYQERFPELLLDMAWYQIKTGNYSLAETYLVQAGNGMNSLSNDLKDMRQLFSLRVQLAAVSGNLDQYYFWNKKNDSLTKKLFGDGLTAVIKTRNELTNAQEKQRQERELLQRRNMNVLLGTGSIIFFGLFYYYFVTGRKMKTLSIRNELLVREQNHRVKNNLQMISSLLSLQVGRTNDEISKQALRQSQSRIQAISLLNRSLYDQAKIGEVDLNVYIKELITEVINSITDRQVNYNLEVEALRLDLEKVTSIGLIINELIVNSVKYVNSVNIEFLLNIKSREDNIELEYYDNGTNFNVKHFEQSRSFGKRLIELQVSQIQGRLEYFNQKNFRTIIRFGS